MEARASSSLIEYPFNKALSHMFSDKSNKLETHTYITRIYFDESNKLETYTYIIRM